MNRVPSVTIGVLFFLNSVLLSHQKYRDTSTTLVYAWRTAEFDYASEKARDEAIKSGQFTPENVLILEANYDATRHRYFVTTPQFRNGTPASLSEVVKGKNTLKPFPNWPNKNNRCRSPFSVFRTHIDKCGLLWVPDSGRSDVQTGGQLTCTPKLLVYDLNNNDKEILNYEFPSAVYNDQSVLLNIVTESYREDCSDTIAYVADSVDYGLIVFDYARKSSYRIENRYFGLFPQAVFITSNDRTFQLYDGLFGLALGPPNERNRKLYFHSFASFHESWVRVSVLKNQTLANDPEIGRTAFKLSPGRRAGQSTTEVMTDDGILIYPLITTNSLACWNFRTPFRLKNQHVLHRDDENFQFISGTKLIGNKLLITSCHYQNYNAGILNGTDVKYRVLVIEDVKSLLQDTPCTSASGYYGQDTSDECECEGSYQGSQSGGSNGGGSLDDEAKCYRPQSS